MPLFIAEHRHLAERCPAQDPQSAGFLVRHLSAPEAERHGVHLHGEAVETGQHHLVLIVDAPEASTVSDYLAPFAAAGSVEVHPASSCETVAARGHC
ncbi:MAG: DUF3303 domain-containing protein [Thermoplasmata archaeon]